MLDNYQLAAAFGSTKLEVVLTEFMKDNSFFSFFFFLISASVSNLSSLAPNSWSGSHIRWGQAFRLRHLTTGHYLALTEDKGLVLQDRERSDTVATAFCFRASKVRT